MITKTTNCNIYKEKDFVYCGRGQGIFNDPIKCSKNDSGYFGNPIAIGRICHICKLIHRNGGSTLSCYEVFLRERLTNNAIFRAEFLKLKGKKLGCFCKPNPCHTDIMIEYLDNDLKDIS